MGPRTRSQVLRVEEDEHLPLLAEFIAQVWTPGMDPGSLREARARAAARNRAQPGEAPPTFLFLVDGRPVGHLTTIPTLLGKDGRRWPAHWLKGFWVLPEHRNGPIGAMLVREACRQLDCIVATVVDSAPRRVFEAFQIRDRGCLTEHVKILRPGRVLTQVDPDQFGVAVSRLVRKAIGVARWPVIAPLANGMIRAGLGIPGLLAPGARDLRATTDPSAGSSTDLDSLWSEMMREGTCGPVRDAEYRSDRYGECARNSDEPYTVITLDRQRVPRAWAVLRRSRAGGGHPRLRGIRLATLVEIVAPSARPQDCLALLREAEMLARTEGSDALLCSTSHGYLRGCLSKRGFLPLGGNLHLAARDPRGGPPLPDSIDDWWITRADGGADESL